MPTVREMLTDAFLEATIKAAGEVLSADDATWGLNIYRRILNEWNADRLTVYASSFQTFTLVPNLTPHTIGPTGTFVTTIRPVSIEGCNIVLSGSGTTVNTPVRIVDAMWWLSQPTQEIETTLPTDLYYQPDWPDGSLFFWPVPTIAYDVQFLIRVLLDDTVTLNDDFSLPPGYANALTLTTAEALLTSYGVPRAPTGLMERASKARARVFANNDVTPDLQTQDVGMPGQNTANRPTFNWMNRTFVR